MSAGLKRDVPRILAVAQALAEMAEACETAGYDHSDDGDAATWWYERAIELRESADRLRMFAGSVA